MGRVIVVALLLLFIGFVHTGCNLVTEPDDLGAPVPGNAGVLTMTDVHPNSMKLSWGKATDDKSRQQDLEYQVVYSHRDNIASIDQARSNGTVSMNWTRDVSWTTINGLPADSTVYFNVLVRDEADNESAYIMIRYHADSPEKPTESSPKIFWVDNGNDMVLSANLDGTQVDTLLSDFQMNITTPNYLAIDRNREKLYLTDWSTDRVIRMNFDGSDPRVIVSNPDVNGPVGIAFDNRGDRLFFLDQFTDILNRSAPDGSLIEPILTGILNTGYGLTIDEIGRNIYWTDWGDTLVYRADLAGRNSTVLLSSDDGIRRPLGMAVDSVRKHVYFTDAATDILYRVNTDGTGLQELHTGLQFPIDCALDLTAMKLYWVDSGMKLIERSELDGSGRETILDISGTGANPYAIAVWNP